MSVWEVIIIELNYVILSIPIKKKVWEIIINVNYVIVDFMPRESRCMNLEAWQWFEQDEISPVTMEGIRLRSAWENHLFPCDQSNAEPTPSRIWPIHVEWRSEAFEFRWPHLVTAEISVILHRYGANTKKKIVHFFFSRRSSLQLIRWDKRSSLGSRDYKSFWALSSSHTTTKYIQEGIRPFLFFSDW